MITIPNVHVLRGVVRQKQVGDAWHQVTCIFTCCSCSKTATCTVQKQATIKLLQYIENYCIYVSYSATETIVK